MPLPAVQISVTVPASLADEGVAVRARTLLVLDAVRTEQLSWRQGAAELGLAPDAFLDLARDHGVAVHHVNLEDLENDLATVHLLDLKRRGR